MSKQFGDRGIAILQAVVVQSYIFFLTGKPANQDQIKNIKKTITHSFNVLDYQDILGNVRKCQDILEHLMEFQKMLEHFRIFRKFQDKLGNVRNVDLPNFLERNPCGGAVCTTCLIKLIFYQSVIVLAQIHFLLKINMTHMNYVQVSSYC